MGRDIIHQTDSKPHPTWPWSLWPGIFYMAICFKRLCAILQITSLSHSLVTPTFLIIKSEHFHLLIITGIMCTKPGLRSVVGPQWSLKSRVESLELAHTLLVGSCSDPAPNLFAPNIVIFGRATNTPRSKTPRLSYRGSSWMSTKGCPLESRNPCVTKFLTTGSEISDSLFKNRIAYF